MGRLDEYDDVERKVIEPTRFVIIDDPVKDPKVRTFEEKELLQDYRRKVQEMKTRSIIPPTLALVLLLSLLSFLCLPIASFAGSDIVQFSTRGDVFSVGIYRDADTSAYKFTRLFLYISPDDPTLFPSPNDIFIVNCDGLGGGDLTNCQFVGAFLGGSNCTPLQVTHHPAHFVGHPINDTVTLDLYTCKSGASKSAGSCVEIDGSLLHVFTQGTHNQVLWPWAEMIDWPGESACQSK